MPVPFLNSVNLNKNEVQNFKVFNIGNDPTPTLTANDGGYFWFDSTTTPTPVLRLKYWTGTEARTLLDSASTTIVAADLSGGAAGSLPYQVGAGDTDFLGIGTAGQVLSVSSGVPAWVNQSSLSVGSATTATTATTADKVANALTAGTYLTSGGTFDGSTARTFAVDATSANTASKVVARDGSGNFSAGTITASLTGTASNATNVNGGDAGSLLYQTATNFTGALSLGSAGYILRVNTGATAPEWSATIPSSSVSGLAASATTDTTNAANISSGLLPLARLALATGQFYLGDASNNPVATAKTSIPLSGFGAAGADVAMGGFKITGLADPVDATDAANRKYVDEVAQGLDVKASCLTATTTNINLSAPTASIGGVTISTVGSRVLVKDQTDKTQNGIYLWQGASSAMTRSLDADTVAKLVGAFTFVEQGTNADSGWVCQVDSGTIGSVDIEWTKFSQAGSYTAGNGMVLSGGVFHFAQSSAYTAGQIPFCSNSPTANSIGFSSNLFWDNGNNRLGIGTTPSESLDVNGAIYVRGANALKLDNASNNYVAQIKNTGASGQSSLEFLLGSPYGTKMTLDNSGNLGLGVTPSAWSLGRAFENSAGAFFGYSTSELHVTQNAYYNAGWKYTNSSVGAGRYFINSGAHSWYTAPSGTAGNAITFTQAMTLDASGNLGVGTTSPSAKLEVSDTTSAAATALVQFTGQNNYELNIQSLTTTNSTVGARYNFAVNSSNGEFSWSNSGGERLRIDSTGNVGIGTATPGLRLDVVGFGRFQSTTGSSQVVLSNDGGLLNFAIDSSTGGNFGEAYSKNIYCTGAQPLRFWTNGVDRMRIDSTGNVGIGTTTPSSFTGNLKVAIGTGSGVAGLTLYGGNATFSGLYFADGTTGNETYRGYLEYDHATDSFAVGTAGANKMFLTSGGNLGLGVTPSAGVKLQLPNGELAGWAGTSGYLVSNTYYGSGDFRYVGTGAAARYQQVSGAHAWLTAPSGTAGNAISFTQAMTLDASGKLTVAGNLTYQEAIKITNGRMKLGHSDGGAGIWFNSATVDGKFFAGLDGDTFRIYSTAIGSDAVRITDSGNLGLAATPKGWITYKSASIGGIGSAVFGLGSSQAGLGQGCFYNNNAGTGWAYTASSQAAGYYLQISGEHKWYTAAGGTADAEITAFSAPKMTLDASGNLGVGATTPVQPLEINKSSSSTALTSPPVAGSTIRVRNTSNTDNAFSSLEFYNSAGLFGGSVNCQFVSQATPSNDLVFVTRGSSGGLESLRITSAGSTLSGVNGTASNPSFSRIADPNTGLYFPTGNDTLALAVGGSDAVYIDSSRNVGIGTNPGYKLDIRDNSTGLLARLSSTSTGGCSMQFVSTSTNGRTYRIGSNYVSGAGEFSIYDDTAGLERLRIKSTGQLNFTGLASDPAGAAGDVVYNSTSNRLKYHNGTAWVDSGTRKVSVVGGAGTGTYIDATHNFNTKTVSVTVLRTTDNVVVYTDVAMTNDNTVRVTFASSVTLADYTVTVIG